MLHQNLKMNFIQKIYTKMASIVINGVQFIGDNVTVKQNNNKVDVYVNGSSVHHSTNINVTVTVNGDLKSLDCTNCVINGNVTGNVDATNVKCGDVGGDIDGTNVEAKNVMGKIDAINFKRK